MSPTKPSLLLFLAILVAQPLWADDARSATENESRIWTSHAGSEFFGRLVAVEDGSAVLAGSDGTRLTVPLDQLSASDRTYLRNRDRERHHATLEFYSAGVFEGTDLPTRAAIKGVPHVVQRENFCVPASAEMVLRFHGFPFDQDYLASISSRDSSRSAGTNLNDLGRALRNLGIDSVALGARSRAHEADSAENLINGIRSAINDGYPVLVSYDAGSIGHVVVAMEYDDRRRAFWVMDPARRGGAQRLDYRVLESVIMGASLIVPPPQIDGETTEPDTEFLSRISNLLRATEPPALRELPAVLGEKNIPARFRDANRNDLRASQGQTRSYARQQGVEFVRLALQRGAIVVAPQQFDEGPGLILVYGTNGNEFSAVEYLPDGTFRRGEVRVLDFSLRWLWRENNLYSLPLVEIET